MANLIRSSGFIMAGAREVIDLSAGGVYIEQQVKAIEDAVDSTPGLTFDLARSLVETVCKTILNDCGQDCGNIGLKDLLKKTYDVVQTVPDSHASNRIIVDSIEKILTGFDTIIWGLTELRNNEGLASHGKDAYTEPLEAIQARLAAQSADTVIHFLYSAHKSYLSPSKIRKIRLEDNPEFNTFLDDTNGSIEVSGLSYQPCEVLFNVDLEAYRLLLSDYIASAEIGSAP